MQKLVKVGVQIARIHTIYKFCEAKLGRFTRLLQNCRLIQRWNASVIYYFPPEKYNLYRYAHTRTCVGAFCFGINLCFGNNPAKRSRLRSKLVAERRLNYRCKTDYVRSRFAERNPTRAGSYMVQFQDLFFMLNPCGSCEKLLILAADLAKL